MSAAPGANSPPVKGEWREAARGFRSKPQVLPELSFG